MKKIVIILLIISLTYSIGCLDNDKNQQNNENPYTDNKKTSLDINESQELNRKTIEEELEIIIVEDIEIEFDQMDIRANKDFNCEVVNIPSTSNITWNFGDGVTKYGISTSHNYHSSNIYDIKVEIKWELSVHFIEGTIEVKNKDTITMFSGTINKFIWGYSGFGIGTELKDGLSIPKSEIFLNITQLTCALNIEIGLYGKNNELIHTLQTEAIERGSPSVELYWNINQNDITPYFSNFPIFLKCTFVCDDHTGHAECIATIFVNY
jgi:hypothetical protein